MLISHHIPRTSGTAWRICLESNIAAQLAVEAEGHHDALVGRARTALEDGDFSLVRAIFHGAGRSVLHGHLAADFLTAFDNVGAAAWLRDPADRVVSEFLELKGRGGLKAFKIDDAHPDAFSQYLSHRPSRYHSLRERFEEAGAVYGFFIDTHRTEAFAVCQAVLGWKHPMPRRNKTPPEQQGETADLRAQYASQLARQCQDDVAIYQEWQELWQSGAAQERLRAALSFAPRYEGAPFGARMKRKAGILKERLGHALGRDWR